MEGGWGRLHPLPFRGVLWLPRRLSRSRWNVEVEPVLLVLLRLLLGEPYPRLRSWAWWARDELEPAVLLGHRGV